MSFIMPGVRGIMITEINGKLNIEVSGLNENEASSLLQKAYMSNLKIVNTYLTKLEEENEKLIKENNRLRKGEYQLELDLREDLEKENKRLKNTVEILLKVIMGDVLCR